MKFEAIIDEAKPSMELFWQHTLARLMLSFVPMADYLDRVKLRPKNVGSFGSGSCAHETFFSRAFPKSHILCHDITTRYIPPYLKEYVLEDDNNIAFQLLSLGDVEVEPDQFDFAFSIQTLEHVEDYRSFLDKLTKVVKPRGYLYLDAPFYHMEDEREDNEKLAAARKRQWQNNEHYHLGFSPTKLIQDPILENFQVVLSGFYSFEKGDKAAIRPYLGSDFSRLKSTGEYCDYLGKLLKRNLVEHDTKQNLDDHPYFKRPANAFRLLLKKN